MCICSRVTPFLAIVDISVYIYVLSYFQFCIDDRIASAVLIVSVPGHCLYCTFSQCRIPLDPLGNEPDQQQTPATISSSIAQDDSFVPDGYIFVSTEHNGCIPPSLTTVLYQHEKEYFCQKPSLVVVYSEGL